MARLRRTILAAGFGWPDVPPAAAGRLRDGLGHLAGPPSLVSRDEPGLACGCGGGSGGSRAPLGGVARGARRRTGLCRPSCARRGGRKRGWSCRADGRRRRVSRRVRGGRAARRAPQRRGAPARLAQQRERRRGARPDRLGVARWPVATIPPAHARIRGQLGDHRWGVPRHPRRRLAPLRQALCYRPRVPGRKRVFRSAHGDRGARRCAPTPGFSTDPARRLLACRAHGRSLAAGRPVPDRPGMCGALGLAARDGVAAAATSGGVWIGLDRNRVPARVQPAVLERCLPRRADVVPAVRRAGARGGYGARSASRAAVSAGAGAARPGRRRPLGAAHAGVA